MKKDFQKLSVDWSNVINVTDVNAVGETFNDNVLRLLNKLAPISKKREMGKKDYLKKIASYQVINLNNRAIM